MIQIMQRSLRNVHLRRCIVNAYNVNRSFCDKIEKSEEENVIEKEKQRLSGFAKAFEKFSKPDETPAAKEPDLPFATLFRNSKFVELGDPENKVVVGQIFHIVDDDLYIDFGWKFHCVCTRPQKNPNAYVRGARVKLRVKDLELSTRFLGSSKDLTLLEADCQILGILSSPAIPRVKA